MRFVDRSEIIVKRVSRVEMGFVLGEYVSSGAPTKISRQGEDDLIVLEAWTVLTYDEVR